MLVALLLRRKISCGGTAPGKGTFPFRSRRSRALACFVTISVIEVAIGGRVSLLDLFRSLFSRDPVPLLDLPQQLVVFAGDDVEVIVCHLPHFSFTEPFSCFHLPSS